MTSFQQHGCHFRWSSAGCFWIPARSCFTPLMLWEAERMSVTCTSMPGRENHMSLCCDLLLAEVQRRLGGFMGKPPPVLTAISQLIYQQIISLHIILHIKFICFIWPCVAKNSETKCWSSSASCKLYSYKMYLNNMRNVSLISSFFLATLANVALGMAVD